MWMKTCIPCCSRKGTASRDSAGSVAPVPSDSAGSAAPVSFDSADGGPLLVGLIADIQYADADDGTDFLGKEHRYFRNSLKIAEAAVATWNAHGVDVVIQLGDLIDGINAKMGKSEEAMRRTLEVLSHCTAPRRLDLVGNHELYTFNRPNLHDHCGLHFPGGAEKFYHSTQLNAKWDAIILDPFEIAMIGYAEDDPQRLEAVAMMQANNPAVLQGAGGDWFANGVTRWVPYNGAVSSEQIAWLRSMLAASEAAGRSVLLFTHVPLLVAASKTETVLWNAEEVLAVLHDHRDTVVAVLAGHDHNGGYAVDFAGVHHITMNSPMTALPGSDCFAILECYDGWARFMSHGRACSESAKDGRGGYYPELMLAKGAVNRLEYGFSI